MAMAIVDATDAIVASNSIGSGQTAYVKVVLVSPTTGALANKLVTLTVDSAVATLSQTAALTDVNGAIRVQITPVSLIAANAGNIVAASTVGTVSVSANLDYQTTPANVSLSNLRSAPSAISALQTTAVTAEARINGALGAGVVVDFSASCGVFSPVSASTNSLGVATTTYQSAVTCSGPVTLTSRSAGAPAISTAISVTAAQPANLVFDSATAALMVLSSANSGVKQSTLRFKVLDGTGAGMPGQTVNLVLSSASIGAGVSFSVGGLSTAAQQVVTTDATGFAAVTVTSGSIPTPVVVTATLGSNLLISASSSGVAVTSGRATQNAASLSVTKYSIEAFNADGVQTSLIMRVADRQGNPVPAGAVVNFVASHGLVQGSCLIDTASQCTVNYTSQGLRPVNGRVAILAYMDGEESFVDLNSDNIWQFGETFYDVGTVYRDDNESGIFDPLTEQTYPGGAVGVSACAGVTYSYPSVANSCDGTWSSSIRVRRQVVIALATTSASVTAVSGRALGGFTVRVTDMNGNSMPTGTAVSAAVKTAAATCTVTSVSPNAVLNSPNGGNHGIRLDGAADCATVRVDVTVTPPSGSATIVGF